MAKWIDFKLMGVSVTGKTLAWSVLSTSAVEVLLGEVRWYGPWRKYSFFPNRGLDLVFEKDCLRDIANFCEQETRTHRAKPKLAIEKEAQRG